MSSAMNSRILVTFSVFYFAASLFSVSEAQCNVTALDECISRFKNASQDLQAFLVNSTTDLDWRCKDYNTAVSCVGSSTGCKDTDKDVATKWLGLKQSVGYVCNSARSDYLTHAPCLSNDTFTSSLKTNCSAVYQNPVKDNLDALTTCKQFSDELKCRQAVAAQSCSAAAGNFYRKFYQSFLELPVKQIAPSCTGNCISKDLDKCKQDFVPLSSKMQNAELNETQLNDACSVRSNAATCVKQNTQCTDDDTITQLTWLGSSKAAEFVCGEGKAAYVKNRVCLSNTTNLNARQKCSTTPQTCQTIISDLACVKNLTNSACGSEAATFLAQLNSKLQSPYIQATTPNCTLPDYKEKNGAASLFYSTLVLVISMLLSKTV